MAIGNPITLTSNVSSKTITTTSTAGQTTFIVAGGYRINQISVFRNGVKLAADDYQARDGSTIVLSVGANAGDTLEFQIFDDFRAANVLDVNSGGTIGGSINVNGSVTATSFVGNVTGNLTGNVSGTASGLSGIVDINAGVVTARSGIFTGGISLPTAPFIGFATFIGANYVTPANTNTLSVGPLGINTGIAVTVTSGTRWVIV